MDTTYLYHDSCNQAPTEPARQLIHEWGQLSLTEFRAALPTMASLETAATLLGIKGGLEKIHKAAVRYHRNTQF